MLLAQDMHAYGQHGAQNRHGCAKHEDEGVSLEHALLAYLGAQFVLDNGWLRRTPPGKAAQWEFGGGLPRSYPVDTTT